DGRRLPARLRGQPRGGGHLDAGSGAHHGARRQGREHRVARLPGRAQPPALRGLQGGAGRLYAGRRHGARAARHPGERHRAGPDRHAAAARPDAAAAGRATGPAAHRARRRAARRGQRRVVPGRAAHGLHHRPGAVRGRRQVARRFRSLTPMDTPRWNSEVDAIVVGSGAAGMTAALTAHTEGLQVLLVEKTGRIGGSTASSGGALWLPLNDQSAAAGHPDTYEQVWAYLEQTVGDAAPAALKRAYLEAAPRVLRYLAGHGLLEA